MTFRKFDQLSQEHRIIEYVAQHLSHQNREEIRICYPGKTIREVLALSVENTKHGFSIHADNGDPAGIGGLSSKGRIWFVVTEDAPAQLKVSWFKAARKWLLEMHEKHRRIDGYVWTQNKLSHQWMNFMGFDICSEETYATIEINKEKFLYFMRTA